MNIQQLPAELPTIIQAGTCLSSHSSRCPSLSFLPFNKFSLSILPAHYYPSPVPSHPNRVKSCCISKLLLSRSPGSPRNDALTTAMASNTAEPSSDAQGIYVKVNTTFPTDFKVYHGNLKVKFSHSNP